MSNQEKFPRLLRSRAVQDQPEEHYTLLETLGSGGQANVYLAVDPKGNRVALKYAKASSFNGPQDRKEATERFIREFRMGNALTHPNHMPILHMGKDVERDEWFYVMPYIEGGQTLDSLIQAAVAAHSPVVGTCVPRATIIHLFLQLLDAVEAIHDIDCIHRDLKPENILLEKREDGTWHVILADLGIVKALGDQAKATFGETLVHPQKWIGTPLFMAPEQCRGVEGMMLEIRDGKQVFWSSCIQTDIWALGIILYIMCTGVDPYGVDDLGRLIALITSEQASILSFASKGVINPDQKLEWLVRQMLRKQPGKRPASTRIVRDLLLRNEREPMRELPSDEQTPTLPPTIERDPSVQLEQASPDEVASSRDRMNGRSRRIVWSLVGVCLAGLVAVTAVGLFGGSAHPPSGLSVIAPLPAPTPVLSAAPPVPTENRPYRANGADLPYRANTPPIPTAPSAVAVPSAASALSVLPVTTASVVPAATAVTSAPAAPAKRKAALAPAATSPEGKRFQQGLDAFNAGDCRTANVWMLFVITQVPSFPQPSRILAECARQQKKTAEACKRYADYLSFEDVAPLSESAQDFVAHSCSKP